MLTQLTLGVGYQERILSVASSAAVPGGKQVAGVIRLWKEDRTAFKLLLDGDGIVRQATLTTELEGAPGAALCFEIENSGTAAFSKGIVARQGLRKRFDFAPKQNRQLDRDTALTEKVALRVDKLEIDLPAAEFDQRCRMERPKNAYVEDKVNGDYLYVDARGRAKTLSKLGSLAGAAPPPDDRFWFWLILGHGVVFAAVAGIAYLGWRRKKLRLAAAGKA